jgi:hypothetical protein
MKAVTRLIEFAPRDPVAIVNSEPDGVTLEAVVTPVVHHPGAITWLTRVAAVTVTLVTPGSPIGERGKKR